MIDSVIVDHIKKAWDVYESEVEAVSAFDTEAILQASFVFASNVKAALELREPRGWKRNFTY